MKTKLIDWFEKFERLRSAEALWKEDVLPVEIIQTHISVILLGKERVLKLKKPVDFAFLDYSTPEKRREACESEIKLNRRLCPEIYLGTKAIIESEVGSFSYEGEGEIVDYGVLMKRLPDEKMLNRMVTDNSITESIIAAIAGKLNKFHQTARRGADVDLYGSIETIRYNWDENFKQTEAYIDSTISRSDFQLIREWVERWIENNEALLRERVGNGHICDGHGDVRCESICVTNDISIFDCVEFNERFRCADVANEAAFLAMDLDAYGRADLGYFFFEEYAKRSGDERIFDLYLFYRCYRAFVRGKVLSFQLDEAELSEEAHEAARERAGKYFAIAVDSTKPLQKPTVIMVSGNSGTGKTSIARAIAGELGIRVISSDEVRRSLFGADKKTTEYGKGKYDAESNRRTYKKMFDIGFEFLKNDAGVIFDAKFGRSADRQIVEQKAISLGAECRLIECRLSPEMVRQRLILRAEKKDGLSDANWQIYRQQISDFEPFFIGDKVHLQIDTALDLSTNRRRITDWLRDLENKQVTVSAS